MPTSLPWRLSVVGSCTKKISSRSRKRDLRRIEAHAHHLGATGVAAAHLLVGSGVRRGRCCSRLDADDAAHALYTASTHQKQPPPRVMVSFGLMPGSHHAPRERHLSGIRAWP